MKTAKRIIAVFVAFVMLLSCLVVSASAADEKLNYLVIGDSIAEGFGVTNRDESAYGKIVADTNGYNYKDLGHMGYTSDYLLELLETNATYEYYVKWADIISVSVGGNDFLLDNPVGLVLSGIIHYYKPFDKRAVDFNNNFEALIEKIHEINPDAVVLVQTLYNSWTTFAHDIFEACAERINSEIYSYLEENPGSYYVVDTREPFYKNPSLITTDTIHPNAAGNVALARVTLQTLYDIGLGSTTEPVILVEGIDRDYLIEYFPVPLGHIITFAACFATGVRYH